MRNSAHKTTEGFLKVGADRLEYTFHDCGNADRPVLIMLHEGLGSVRMWREYPLELALVSSCSVLVFSRRGYGRSSPRPAPWPLSYMHEEAQEILPLVLDAAGVERAIMLGHSDGASIALIHAGSTQDKRVSALVLMAPHVFCEPISVQGIELAKQKYRQGELRRLLQRYHGSNVDNAFWGWNRAWLDPDFLEWNIENYLPEIRIPLLLIQGEDDEYGTLRQLQAIENRVDGPVEKLVLPGCGHSPHRDRREETLRAIADFAKRLG
ncbi:MAG: alpha/beta hydrolase [Gammaproteobacteria bacterium]|nr:alpha/beta hydrolase [Gammaproteobacteria bacterium]